MDKESQMIPNQSLRFQHDPRKLVNCLAERAKRWWGATAVMKVFAVIFGAISVLVFPNFKPSAVIVFLLVRPAGRSYLGVKVSYEPDRGNR